MINLKTINERFNKLEQKLIKLESKRVAKEALAEILKSGYTDGDLYTLKDEVASDKKDDIFKEIVKELKTHNDVYNYYSSKSNDNLFECTELDKDLLDVIEDMV